MITARPTTLATHGMIATPHYLASAAGLRVLQDGGNAMDAAIAANAVLNVVYPHMCSLGGDAFAMVWDPADKKVHALNGSGRSGREATIDAVRASGATSMPERGGASVTVPGAVNAWATLLERFGSFGLDRILASATDYAKNGFAVSPGLSKAAHTYQEMLSRCDASKRQFLPNGRPPAAGEVLRQPDLAVSFERLAADGPSAFYSGSIAESIVDTVRHHGGFLNLDDLKQQQANWVNPISSDYHGYQVMEMPPNTQGITALQLLNIAEGFNVSGWGLNSATAVHHFIEAKKQAFADRDQYITDPESLDIPIEKLISKAYADEMRSRIDSERASTETLDPAGAGDTIYLCVIDDNGMAVSLIQSIFQGFGSGLVADGAGMVLQNRGASFSLDSSEANALAPGKRPMHTLIPAMILKDNDLWTVFGTMGGHGQAQTHLQLVSDLVDFGLEPQAAIETPRWVAGRGEPDDPAHVVRVEPGLGDDVINALRTRGHDVRLADAWSSLMGHANVIQIDQEHGVLKGASDPRSDGYALGW